MSNFRGSICKPFSSAKANSAATSKKKNKVLVDLVYPTNIMELRDID